MPSSWKNIGAIAIGLCLVGITGVNAYQHWQQKQASRPDYDNANPPPSTHLAPPPGQSETWQVIRVSDGDTIVARSGRREERIRFCGIDAPEVTHDNEPGQPLGEESKAYLQQLIDQAGGTITIMEIDRDRYGRSIAEVFTISESGEKLLQQEMLIAGMAYVYPQYVSSCANGKPMQMAEAIAQEQRVGVWAGDYQRPWEFRQAKREP